MGLPRGPRPTPPEVLRQRGSPRANKCKKAPRPPYGTPRCPKWLDDEAKIVWGQVIEHLQTMGVLAKSDGIALARYCRLFVRWKRCAAFIQQYGESYPMKDKLGNVVSFAPHPQVNILNKLSGDLLRLEHEFGLTPSARARIEVDVPEPVEPEGKGRFFGVVRAG